MPTHRLAHSKRYFVASNHAAQDEDLSWAARGLLMFMLSMPEDWSFNMTDLARRSPGGRETTRTALAALEHHGYVYWKKDRAADGSFESIMHVYEDVSINPYFKKKNLRVVK